MIQTVRKRRGLGRWLLLLAVLVVAFLIYRHFTHKPAAPPQMPPAQVSAITVQPQNIALTYEYAGRISGAREAEIRARVSGILLQRSYEEGSKVDRGDLLFRIDPAPFVADFNNAQAKLTAAASDWGRAQKLFKLKALSSREYDQARSTYEQAKAQTDTARINLGYTTVRAPISGFTSHEDVTEGTLVQADQTVLTHISQLDPIYIYFGSPDEEMLDLRRKISDGSVLLPPNKKLQAEIHTSMGGVYPQLAVVDFTDSMIDPTTGTVSMRAIVHNVGGMLLPGQFVRVYLKGLTAKGAFAVPDSAIMQGPPGTFVYTIGADGKAAITPVTLGKLDGEMRLIDKGLKAGDQVVTEGMIKVMPGAPVQIAQPKPAGDAVPQGDAAAAPATDKAPAPAATKTPAPAAPAKKG